MNVFTPVIPVTITGGALTCKFSRVLQRDKTIDLTGRDMVQFLIFEILKFQLHK